MSSLWTLAKDKTSQRRTSVRTARLDLTIGYVGTAILAYAFVLLGTAVMYGSGQQFSDQGTAFSAQLIDLYGQTLGDWARPIVSVAALSTMLSTVVIVTDGFPRVIERCLLIVSGATPEEGASDLPQEGRIYWMTLTGLGVTSVVILAVFSGSLTGMLDFATILSFSVGPVLGYLNLRAVTSPAVPVHLQPGTALRWFSYAGVLVLASMTVAFFVSKFF